MATKVWIDGEIVDGAEARISVFDRGFLYGDSVFEVMRTYGGVPFAQAEHLARLRRSAQRVLIPMPVAEEVLASEIAATLAAAGNEESYVRVVVTRGSGPLTYDPATARDPTRLVIVTPLPAQPPELYTRGVAVVTVRSARETDETSAAGAKASNYLANLLALHEARQRGGYEAILVSTAGQVLEGASSNIFAVRRGVVRTPRPEAGILEGITRATILAVAADEGITVEQGTLFPRDLYDAEEVFLTSSLREVAPVISVDDHVVGTGAPGPLTGRLHRAFRAAVARACGGAPPTD